MKKNVKLKIWLLIAADILIIPACFFFRWLSSRMLAQPGDCMWTLMGLQCVTCGGTRLVNSLLNGHIIQAFAFNPFVFLSGVCLFLSYILLHLWWIWKIPLSGKILKKVYSIPGLIIYGICIFCFLIVRNLPALIKLIDILATK